MPHADFVHLRVHSAYSLLEGAIRVPDLVNLAVDRRMPAVAITRAKSLPVAGMSVAAFWWS